MPLPSGSWWFFSLATPLAVAVALSAVTLVAQAPEVPIRAQTPKGLQAEEDAIGKQLEALVTGDRLATRAMAEAWCKAPTPRTLQLPPPNTQELAAPAIAMQARRTQLRVGWCYLCTHCDHWHTAMGLGYALTADGAVATCAHALHLPPMEMRDARLVAVTSDGVVHPVTAVLANHEGMDAAIVAIDLPSGTAPLVPLPLATDVRPGDSAFCWSRPLEQRDFFGTGMVNRFYLDRDVDEEHGRDSLTFLAAVRMDVDMPWAPGSSGAALLDQRGNAIGHVSEIRPLSNGMPAPGMPGAVTAAEVAELGDEHDPELDKPATLGDLEARHTMITLHVAVPVRGLQLLATAKSAPANEAVKPAGK
ncbi:MAG: serine protease [Planctomycetes bacterium]|nr:serine protease [Planctomycetota bacterium]